jgi:dolichol-phosphate mannosyltransferase
MGQTPLDVSVVLPTFDEADSLPLVVPRICAALGQAGLRGEVIVVDDDSPDGTAQAARALAVAHPVRVRVRTGERGLATAVLEGFRLSSAAVCVVMDADGSHPPDALPDLVRPVLEGRADIAVGSRYVPGGSTPGWSWRRRFMSRSAGRLALGVAPLADATSGFMAARRDLLAALDLDPVGFKIVLEVVVKARGARMLEVPIAFRDRELGRSKMSGGQIWHYLRHLGRLYAFRYLGRRPAGRAAR